MVAVERVARTSLGRMPITLVDRARAQLTRFFSDAPWTVEDDAALSGLIGPGEGWTQDELAPGVTVGFGWRGGSFRLDVAAEDDAVAELVEDDESTHMPVHERTLGDTFEDFVVIESGRNPAELRFATGPGTTGGMGRFTRDEQGSSATVAALFREFDQIDLIRIDSGVVSVEVNDAVHWHDILLQVFDEINVSYVKPRAIPPDRQYERALAEIGTMSTADPRDLARILDAVTSPDAAYRRVAVAKLENADPLVVQKPWTRSLEDSSRAVRRAAIRAMAHAARPDLRAMFERALGDKDACVRYYALRGIAQIGVGRADQSVDRRKRDDDVRVRLAAVAAMENRVPQ
jgi:HEAT repeats/Scaffold protein Nfu/NifU N terminal